MDPQQVFCPQTDCPARGQIGQGNIGVHSQKEQRFMCRVCQKTFSARTGTAFFRLRSAEALVTLVVTLLAYGCPLQAVVVAFRLDERTVQDWHARAGQQTRQVHAHLVEQPRDLGQVQADELWAKLQGLIAWMALAMQVSTRLWLGGVVARQRDRRLIEQLVRTIRVCALPKPLLICVDGLATYGGAIRRVFRDPLPRQRQRGRCRLQPWRGLYIAQVIKQYARRRVVSVTRRIVQGRADAVRRLIALTQGGGGINTAYIERLNATFRARLHHLVRRGRGLARCLPTLEHGMYLVGTVYNFCTHHDSLRVRRKGHPDQVGHRWHQRTPAMAAGLTDHCWTVHELLSYQVPLPHWTPPKRRGRPSKLTQALVARWCT